MKKILPFQARTENQKEYIRSIYEHDINFAIGPAGVGKTFITLALAIKLVQEGVYKKIVCCRPLVTCGNEMGFFPGNVNEKIGPYFQVLEILFKEILSQEDYRKYLDDLTIQYIPLELIRGMTYNNTIMIADEMQNATYDQLRTFITRMGQSSKVIINGDLEQIDIQNSGLEKCLHRLEHIEEVSITIFGESDIQRHPVLHKVIQAMK